MAADIGIGSVAAEPAKPIVEAVSKVDVSLRDTELELDAGKIDPSRLDLAAEQARELEGGPNKMPETVVHFGADDAGRRSGGLVGQDTDGKDETGEGATNQEKVDFLLETAKRLVEASANSPNKYESEVLADTAYRYIQEAQKLMKEGAKTPKPDDIGSGGDDAPIDGPIETTVGTPKLNGGKGGFVGDPDEAEVDIPFLADLADIDLKDLGRNNGGFVTTPDPDDPAAPATKDIIAAHRHDLVFHNLNGVINPVRS